MRRGLIGIFTMVVATMLASCWTSTALVRYRMTVEGDHNGTAVYAMLAEKIRGLRLPEEKPGGSIIKGEALVVETSRGPIFLLLQTADGQENLKAGVMHALAPDVPMTEEPYSWAVVRKLSGSISFNKRKAELPRNAWPMMVRFRDLNDPKSVERVEPEAIGVKRILLETTGAEVTTGIEKRFPPWFLKLIQQKSMLSGSTSGAIFTNELVDNLSLGSFSTEIR